MLTTAGAATVSVPVCGMIDGTSPKLLGLLICQIPIVTIVENTVSES